MSGILTRTTIFISDASMNVALTYYTAGGAKISLADLIREDLPIVIGAVVVLVLLILLLIFQRQKIETQRKVNAQQEQIIAARKMAFTDPLTGVKSKHAYVDAENRMDERIAAGTATEFDVGVFDLNNMKKVNDTQGCDAGDKYIREACRLICKCFQHSPFEPKQDNSFSPVF